MMLIENTSPDDGIIKTMIIEVVGEEAMKQFAHNIGAQLRGGETLELIGDIGAGKTTFTKGLAAGLGVQDDVQSPSFTISRVYDGRDGMQLVHYDFYRLDDPGIVAAEVAEFSRDPKTVTVIEWADTVRGVLPDDRMRVTLSSPTDASRTIEITGLPKGISL